MYGYPSIQLNGSLNQVLLLNVTYDLLQNYRRSLEAHSDTTNDLRNYESEAARFQHLLSLAKVSILQMFSRKYCGQSQLGHNIVVMIDQCVMGSDVAQLVERVLVIERFNAHIGHFVVVSVGNSLNINFPFRAGNLLVIVAQSD